MAEYAGPMPFLVVPMLNEAQGDHHGSRAADLPRPTELDFLEPVDDLVEVEDKVRAVGHEKATGTVET